MASTTSSDLLQASLTGNLPSDAQLAFTSERERGNAAYREGRYEAAIDHYTKAEVINPLSPLPPANRSMVYLKQSKWQKARDEAAVALELHNALPTHLHATSLMIKLLLRRATACTNLMLYALAAEDYQTIVNIDPSHTVAKQHLLQLHQQHGVSTTVSQQSNRSSLIFSNSNSSNTAASNSTSPLVRVLDTNDNQDTKNMPSASTNHDTQENGNKFSPHVVRRKEKDSRRSENNDDAMRDETPLFSLPSEAAEELATQAASQAPQSSTQFEHIWRTLRNDPIAQAKYLVHTVGTQHMHFITPCFTPEMLERFVFVLSMGLQQKIGTTVMVADMLIAISKIERFPLLMMFMSDDDKQPFVTLVNRIESFGIVNVDTICALRDSYG